jgi:hypothetical protein
MDYKANLCIQLKHYYDENLIGYIGSLYSPSPLLTSMSLTHPTSLSDPLTNIIYGNTNPTHKSTVWDKDYLNKISPQNEKAIKSAVD